MQRIESQITTGNYTCDLVNELVYFSSAVKITHAKRCYYSFSTQIKSKDLSFDEIVAKQFDYTPFGTEDQMQRTWMYSREKLCIRSMCWRGFLYSNKQRAV